MGAIRPLRREDLEAVGRLYAELTGRAPESSVAGFAAFFERALIDSPFADEELPSLVYDDPRHGVVGVIGSHPRPFLLGERRLRLVCSGPLIVSAHHRERGLGALLLRRFLAGPQEMTFNDRMIDEVHAMWARLGGTTDSAASIGWRRVLAPAGAAATTFSRRAAGRRRPPRVAGKALASLDAVGARRARRPATGSSEPLAAADLAALRAGLRRRFPLRPAFGEDEIAELFELISAVDLDGELVRRQVRGDDGEPLGAYVMVADRHGVAQVLELIADDQHAGLALDHLCADAAAAGSVEVRGRVEPHLLAHLGDRDCDLAPDCWSAFQTRDAELAEAVLAGRGPITRLAGEWWMRPRPELP